MLFQGTAGFSLCVLCLGNRICVDRAFLSAEVGRVSRAHTAVRCHCLEHNIAAPMVAVAEEALSMCKGESECGDVSRFLHYLSYYRAMIDIHQKRSCPASFGNV